MENKMRSTQKLIYSGLLAAIGVILPQILHLIGGPVTGGIFLPMHIPTLIAGFIVGPVAGSIVGILSVVLSYLFTGMPPMPRFPLMVVELAFYGISAGILYKIIKLPIIFSLIGSMVIGRIAFGISIMVATSLFGVTIPPFIAVIPAVITGLPGIVIQLVLIPILITALNKFRNRSGE